MFQSRLIQAVFAACVLFAATAKAQCPAIPNLSSYTNTQLPDLFTFADGVTKVQTMADWACRTAEISTLLQQDELGTMPADPTSVTATFSGTTLAITVTDQGKTMTFSPTITFPTSGTAPYPAIIAMGGISIPAPAGVAIINFDNEGMANQDSSPASRGKGLFYNLYGSTASAGATMAWAWAVRRIMDAVESTPAAKINPARVGVSGCSRNGKGALIAGAFEPRIVLTIPQESGSGGTDSWRLSDYIESTGVSTQTASEIIGENVWFSTNFNQFATTSVNKMPVDHHSLAALIAPRGLFVIDNLGYDWLGPFSSWGAMISARTAWTSMGVANNMGISQSANHSHCVFPSTQQSAVTAFVQQFLLGQTANTNIVQTAGTYNLSVPNSQWASWSVPTLTGTSTTTTGQTTTVGSTTSAQSTTGTTTTTTSVVAPPPPTGCLSAHWGQCGGIGWTGCNGCVSGTTCQVLNAFGVSDTASAKSRVRLWRLAQDENDRKDKNLAKTARLAKAKYIAWARQTRLGKTNPSWADDGHLGQATMWLRQDTLKDASRHSMPTEVE
ncbi:hypothetical protein FB45DRAFT_875903 [Roridomyces roridus]|uniref:(4-O-methyl)-D-glucuronate--lignin esterase n=1 Tax=Roridomyces roridus TaxID=1738132 RepID=A0AAD7FBI1_9AGAR|nr:hypothetical protein FB45DRAFT_875903 [Roridomyces roridus]